MESLEPRIRFKAARGAPRISSPSKRTLPVARALRGSNPNAPMKICVFPDPDSPTMPTHSPCVTQSDTSRTAAMRSPFRKSMLRASILRTSGNSGLLRQTVAQSVADDVQADEQDGKKDAGHQQDPRRALHLDGALGDQRAQARVRFLDAQAEKAQKTFIQDDLRHRQRGVNDHRAQDVRDDVPRDDAARAGSGGHGGLDEFLAANA